ncbi:uncharacterized protein LOC125495195 [Beta vulgaris subsp. vulgaris]|uniref:uncharacterized protein LOC125495195 n=1 Tax=Beta vulgaris subsp. vulgaris TaxID=3555 RepID=UPI0025483C27|nr:uncharacterized protein LOC125495195 [Beta vulgaris subsp. vulgaris]
MVSDTISQASEEGSSRGRGKNKRFWTVQEDNVLIKSLHELASDPRWKGESGFKSGYMNKLEEMIKRELPDCGLRADPHIESRIKHWSEKYSALAEMLSLSGFGWDDEKKMLQVEKKVFDEWAKTHKRAKEMYGVPFPHYDILAEIYAKDKATGDMSESFYGAVKNMNSEIEKEPLTLESDEEDDAISTTQSRKRPLKKEVDLSTPLKKPKKLKDFKDKEQKKLYEGDQLVASLHSVSTNFSTIFENISANLATMASTWSKAEEREQQLDEKVNKILEEVMKLEGISPSEALEAATILMAHEHKLRIFYQAPVNLKKQYILDLLRKK